MNFLGLIILTVLIFLVLGGSRRTALVGMMAGVLYLTQAQQIEALGFNFYAIRFLELAGFVRVMSRHEFSFRELNGIDRALLLLYGYTAVVFLLRSREGVGNQVGMGVDAFLCYFTFRGLVGGVDDLFWFLRALVLLLAPYALLVVIESATGHNLFSVLGGITGGSNWMRHGRPRCFGSFRQPDTLGMFGRLLFALVCRHGLYQDTTKTRLCRNRFMFDISFGRQLRWRGIRGGHRSAGLGAMVCPQANAESEVGPRGSDCRIGSDNEVARVVYFCPSQFNYRR